MHRKLCHIYYLKVFEIEYIPSTLLCDKIAMQGWGAYNTNNKLYLLCKLDQKSQPPVLEVFKLDQAEAA